MEKELSASALRVQQYLAQRGEQFAEGKGQILNLELSRLIILLTVE